MFTILLRLCYWRSLSPICIILNLQLVLRHHKPLDKNEATPKIIGVKHHQCFKTSLISHAFSQEDKAS